MNTKLRSPPPWVQREKPIPGRKDAFRLPDQAHIGSVRLRVSDSKKALGFYSDLLGFRVVSPEESTAALSASGQLPAPILLSELPGARPQPRRTTGLYHAAIRLPDRRALAKVFLHLQANRWPFQGFADHGVSEALYLADPDGNGLELYADRPRETWTWKNGQVAMATDPLDLEGLVKEAEGDPSPRSGIHPKTDIGHVHLHVSDLKQAEEFYHDLLGLDVTQRDCPGALFLSAGGYHHHVGVNIWAGQGAPPPPSDAVGLLSFSLQLPDEEAWLALRERIQEAGLSPGKEEFTGNGKGFLVRDPDRNGIEIRVETTSGLKIQEKKR